MRIDLNWDDAAFLLALLQDQKSKRVQRLRANIVYSMRDYDADSCGSDRVTQSPDIRKRVAYWREKIGDS